MADALLLMRHYLGEYQRPVGCVGVSEEIIRAQALLEWLGRKQLRTVAPGYIMQYGPSSIRFCFAPKC
jgi:hypothetical protein